MDASSHPLRSVFLSEGSPNPLCVSLPSPRRRKPSVLDARASDGCDRPGEPSAVYRSQSITANSGPPPVPSLSAHPSGRHSPTPAPAHACLPCPQVMPDLRWDRSGASVERMRTVPSFAVTLVKASPIPRTDVQRAVVARVARVCLMEGKHTFLSNVITLSANMTARGNATQRPPHHSPRIPLERSLPLTPCHRSIHLARPQDVNGIQKWKFARPPRPGAVSPPDPHNFVIRSDLLKTHPGLMVYIEFNVVHEGYIGARTVERERERRHRSLAEPCNFHCTAKCALRR